MSNIYEIQTFLKELLDPNNMSDYSINGIQVENDGRKIKKIAFAVDASIASIEQAILNKCNLFNIASVIFYLYSINAIIRHIIWIEEFF